MGNLRNYIKELKNNKPQIIKDIALCQILNYNIPDKHQKITDILKFLDDEIKIENEVTKQALSNAHGDWYEWLLALVSWNLCCENPSLHIPILLPNISQFDLANLYIPEISSNIFDLREKVKKSSDVSLITSNPDFILVDRKLFNTIIPKMYKIENLNEDSLRFLSSIYSDFKNKCSFDDVLGYIAVKSSLRPDRRLQISHEGSLMKALYTHIQTREWILEPKGLRFYAMSTKLTKPDINSLKTVATHSITTVSSIPQAAVDEAFEVNSLEQAENVFRQILS